MSLNEQFDLDKKTSGEIADKIDELIKDRGDDYEQIVQELRDIYEDREGYEFWYSLIVLGMFISIKAQAKVKKK